MLLRILPRRLLAAQTLIASRVSDRTGGSIWKYGSIRIRPPQSWLAEAAKSAVTDPCSVP